MTKDMITKLFLLTFLIRIIKSQETTFQDQNYLSEEQDQSDDDSGPRSYEQKTLGYPSNMNQNSERPNHFKEKSSEHYGKNKNQFEIASTFDDKGIEKFKRKSQNESLDKDGQSNQVGEQKKSERPSHLNKDKEGRQRKHETNHDSRNQVQLDKDSTHEKEDSQALDNTTKAKALDETNTNPQDKNKISEHHSHLNKERPSHTFKYTEVTDNDFAYMAAVMKGGSYLCAGALIDEHWVLTAASGIHLMRETIRFLRVRLGSINYKKGGTLLPIKKLEIHPYFNRNKPDYDLALIMLSRPVRYTGNVRSIRLQLTPLEVTATHFIMTSWPGLKKPGASLSIDFIKHHRILSVSHLHPSDPEECVEELKEIGAGHDGVMCFSGVEDACMRDTGAPAVINGVLWGIISSWRPEDCDSEDSILATLVSVKNVTTWIHATVHGHKWQPEKRIKL